MKGKVKSTGPQMKTKIQVSVQIQGEEARTEINRHDDYRCKRFPTSRTLKNVTVSLKKSQLQFLGATVIVFPCGKLKVSEYKDVKLRTGSGYKSRRFGIKG